MYIIKLLEAEGASSGKTEMGRCEALLSISNLLSEDMFGLSILP